MEIINWDEFLLPYQQTVDELCLKFNNIKKEIILTGCHSPIESVNGRVKKIYSILDKANKKNIPYSRISQKIEDIAGIRINCRFVEDIEKVLELIRERNGHDIKILEEKDYITNTKPSGYRSYHVLIKYSLFTINGKQEIPSEIQIRTLAMNFWATIEHSLNYKYNGNMPEDLKKRLIRSAEAAFQLDKEMGKIRGEILEAQKVVQIKNKLVEDILKNIQSLYFTANLDRVNELNKQFFELYEEGNIEQLTSFNNQLKILTELYKV